MDLVRQGTGGIPAIKGHYLLGTSPHSPGHGTTIQTGDRRLSICIWGSPFSTGPEGQQAPPSRILLQINERRRKELWNLQQGGLGSRKIPPTLEALARGNCPAH